LSAYTRQQSESSGRAELNTSNWRGFAEAHLHTTVHQKVEKLLIVVERRTKWPGEYVTFKWNSDYPLIDAVTQEQAAYFIDHALKRGYLEHTDYGHLRLTVEGWEYIDPASAGAGIKGRVFVAMSFDPSLDAVYENGIRPAIETDCHMNAVRIDKVHHNEKICDRILAEIRRCQFVVADFTQQRAGVYFEAGFAMGLGREVIRTCREDDFDNLHFDTRQYPHIKWSSPEDLRNALTERITAVLSC
jgi:hypothetical protein